MRQHHKRTDSVRTYVSMLGRQNLGEGLLQADVMCFV